MCEFFVVARAAYYEWVKKLDKPDPDQERMQQVQSAYEATHRTYDYRRITLHLQQKQGLRVNHKAVLRLMRKLNLRSVARQPKLRKKLEEIGTYHKYPNLLSRDFAAIRPNQKWVTDVTYVLTQQGWAYLSTIKDLYDGFIVGHAFSQSNSIALVTATVRQAKSKEKVTAGLILHSDQGHQYTSQAYHDVLTREYNITPSMSRRGNCWDNAPIENFFGHLKEEYLRQFKKLTFEEARQLINEFCTFPN